MYACSVCVVIVQARKHLGAVVLVVCDLCFLSCCSVKFRKQFGRLHQIRKKRYVLELVVGDI